MLLVAQPAAPAKCKFAAGIARNGKFIFIVRRGKFTPGVGDAVVGGNFAPVRLVETPLAMLALDRLRAAPLERDPFEFVVVEEFIDRAALPSLIAGFPPIRGAGSYPVECLEYGPAFGGLVAALRGPDLARAMADKFAVDLAGRPTLLTARGIGDDSDGRIHTDSATKIITLLLYMNPVWEVAEGRLRLLRGPADLDDFACEVTPLAGTMLAFRRSERSFHGHRPYIGPRRSLQLNWVLDQRVVRRELRRHRWSARLKALRPVSSEPRSLG
jgi:SM-20-related protein